MKIKTITASTPEELDTLVNAFEAEHDVRATQTHFVPFGQGIRFYAVAFYNEK